MTREELERRNRIRLSVAAYAYEYEADSVMTDAEFDELSYKIDKTIKTGNRKLDKFFSEHFDPSTGMWITNHPEKGKLKVIYNKYYKGVSDA